MVNVALRDKVYALVKNEGWDERDVEIGFFERRFFCDGVEYTNESFIHYVLNNITVNEDKNLLGCMLETGELRELTIEDEVLSNELDFQLKVMDLEHLDRNEIFNKVVDRIKENGNEYGDENLSLISTFNRNLFVVLCEKKGIEIVSED